MKLTNVLILLFLLSAFAVGISLADIDMNTVNSMVDNVSVLAENFTLPSSSNNTYLNSGFTVLERFVQFTLVAGTEVMRVGILFGHENPQYFTPEFIIGIIRLIIWATIIGALAVPIMYFVAFLIMLAIWIKDKFKRR